MLTLDEINQIYPQSTMNVCTESVDVELYESESKWRPLILPSLWSHSASMTQNAHEKVSGFLTCSRKQDESLILCG